MAMDTDHRAEVDTERVMHAMLKMIKIEIQSLKQAYGFSEDDALAYKSNPVDSLVPLATAEIPIIAVYGEADVDLPPDENVLLLESRYRALGGEITVIAKPGVGHHPHSLADPAPLLDFILSRINRN